MGITSAMSSCWLLLFFFFLFFCLHKLHAYFKFTWLTTFDCTTHNLHRLFIFNVFNWTNQNERMTSIYKFWFIFSLSLSLSTLLDLSTLHFLQKKKKKIWTVAGHIKFILCSYEQNLYDAHLFFEMDFSLGEHFLRKIVFRVILFWNFIALPHSNEV